MLARLVVDVAFGQPLGPRQDRGEWIVQLMRHAGDGLAECGHLLRLLHLVASVSRLIVPLLALADIADERLDVEYRKLRRPGVWRTVRRCRRYFDPYRRAIDAANADQVVGDRLIAIEQLDERRPGAGIDEAGRVERLNEILRRVWRVAENLLEVWIGGERRRVIRSEGADVDTLANELE